MRSQPWEAIDSVSAKPTEEFGQCKHRPATAGFDW